MRKVALKIHVSLDGLVGTPNGNVDWALRHCDEELKAVEVDLLWQTGTHVMGRALYQDMAAYWPSSTEDHAPPMNEIPKVIFSRTLQQADWKNCRVASGDTAEEMNVLRRQSGGDILVHGGARFAQALSRLHLIDEYCLFVHPVVLGSGLPLFATPLDLELQSSRTFATGVTLLTYTRVQSS